MRFRNPFRRSDGELVEAVVEDRPGAREAFVRRYRPWVAGIAAKRFGMSAQEAEDVFQEVVLRLWQDDLRALRAWRGEGRFSTYLATITTRLCLARRRTAARTEPLGETAEDTPQPPSTEAEPEERALEAERGNAVRAALGALTPRDRWILTLQYRDGLSPTEVAAVLGVRPGAARKAGHDARRRLREALEERFPEIFPLDQEPR